MTQGVLIVKIENRFPKISVVVPIYNVSAYLAHCLEPLRTQTFQDFEAILVDDGSTDNCAQIISEFTAKDSRFSVISQPNMGVSAARNRALEVARGEFIAFLDGDDFVRKDFLEVLYRTAQRYDADIALCNYNLYWDQSGFRLPYPLHMRPGVYSSQRLLQVLIRDFCIQNYLWDKLFRRSLFVEHNIRFPDMCFEDIVVCTQLFYFARRAAVTKEPLYYYVKHTGSLIAHLNAKKINDYLRALVFVRNFLERQKDFAPYRFSFGSHAMRIRVTNYKLIYQMHKGENNFTGFKKNLRASNQAIRHYTAPAFKTKEDFFDFPDAISPPAPSKKK